MAEVPFGCRCSAPTRAASLGEDALFRESGEGVHLRQFFVRRHRRRSGVGRAAIALLKQEVWPQGVRLTVDVLGHNEAAIDFWRSMGHRDDCLSLEIRPKRRRFPGRERPVSFPAGTCPSAKKLPGLGASAIG